MKDYITVVSAVISIGALTVSIINYRRSLKLQNENILYGKKLEAYIEYSALLWDLCIKMDEIVCQIEKQEYNKAEELISNYEILEDQFIYTVVKYSLATDTKISNSLLTLFEAYPFSFNKEDIPENKKTLENFLNKVDQIHELMCDILSVEPLNDRISSRIHNSEIRARLKNHK